MEQSPFDPEVVFVWATTALKARTTAAPYYKRMGLHVGELSARPTGLTQPSAYRDEHVMVNVYEQNKKLRQDFPAMIRWRVQPTSKSTTSKTKIVTDRDEHGKIKLRFA